MRFFVIMCCNILNVWPKTTLLPLCPRDAKRLGTPGRSPKTSFCSVEKYFNSIQPLTCFICLFILQKALSSLQVPTGQLFSASNTNTVTCEISVTFFQGILCSLHPTLPSYLASVLWVNNFLRKGDWEVSYLRSCLPENVFILVSHGQHD